MATLGELAVGSIVKLSVNGTAKNFIVVHQGLPGTMYDSSCDGTWLLMEDIYEKRACDSTNNDYENSDIHSYLNNTFINIFDSGIKRVIKQVKLPYTKGTGSGGTLTTGSSGLSAKVFLLSGTEVGYSDSALNVEGSVLSYFNGAENSKRIAKFDGSATRWWLRSPRNTHDMNIWTVSTKGSGTNSPCSAAIYGVRPAVVLPSASEVNDDGTIIVSVSSIGGQLNINGVVYELTGEGYVNIGGVLCDIVDSSVNIGGTLNSMKG